MNTNRRLGKFNLLIFVFWFAVHLLYTGTTFAQNSAQDFSKIMQKREYQKTVRDIGTYIKDQDKKLQQGLRWNTPEACKGGVPESSLKDLNRNQHQRGWCYAETAANVASIELGFKVSAADIAIKFSAELGDKKNCAKSPYSGEVGGDEALALEIMGPYGFCPDSYLPSQAFESMGPETFSRRIQALAAAAGKHCSPEATAALRAFFPGAVDHLSDLAEILTESTPTEFMSNLAEASCWGKHQNIKKHLATVDLYKSPLAAKQFALIDSVDALKARHPVAMGMNIQSIFNPLCNVEVEAGVLFHPGSLLTCSGRKRAKEYLNPFAFAGHAMTGVGLEFNPHTHQCMVKLLNSWGHDCKCIQAPASCSSNTGMVEIPLDDLAPMLQSTAFYSDSDPNQ